MYPDIHILHFIDLLLFSCCILFRSLIYYSKRWCICSGNCPSDNDSPSSVRRPSVLTKPTCPPANGGIGNSSSSDEDEEILIPAHGDVLINNHADEQSRPESSAGEDEEGDEVVSAAATPKPEVLIEGLDWSQAPTGVSQPPTTSPTPANEKLFASFKSPEVSCFLVNEIFCFCGCVFIK